MSIAPARHQPHPLPEQPGYAITIDAGAGGDLFLCGCGWRSGPHQNRERGWELAAQHAARASGHDTRQAASALSTLRRRQAGTAADGTPGPWFTRTETTHSAPTRGQAR